MWYPFKIPSVLYRLVLRDRHCVKCKDKNFLIGCKCGCGGIRTLRDKKGREKQFIYHHPRGYTKGGRSRYINNEGYVMIRAYNRKMSYRNFVLEHVFVYETLHRCCLLPWTVVHHLNGNREDNQPENLELMSKSKHNTHHNPHPGQWLHCLSCGIPRYVKPRRIRIGSKTCSRLCQNRLLGVFNRSRIGSIMGRLASQ